MTHAVKVDWSAPLPTKRVVKGVERVENKYPVTCPECGHVRYLRASDARKAVRKESKCTRCTARAKGRLGYAATVARHGKTAAIQHVQAHLIAHPSDLEQRVMRVLDQMGMQYEREVWLQTPAGKIYLIDFVIDGVFAIEVNGDWVHQYHIERDQRKMNAIRAEGYRLLVMTTGDVQNAETILPRYLNITSEAAA